MEGCMKQRRWLIKLVLPVMLLVVAGSLWLRQTKRQYALNRELIAALVKEDTKLALSLVNEGGDPNTRFEPMPAPSLKQLLMHFLHHSYAPFDDSSTAFFLVSGEGWHLTTRRPVKHGTLAENLPLLQAMLAHGANVHARTGDNLTALHFAVIEDRLQTVELLLSHGAEVNAQDGEGRTPLMLAAYYDTVNVPRLLLAHGANPNVQDVEGNTALYWGIGSPAATSVIPELLAHGANPNLANKNGVTPLQFAQQAGYSDVARLLYKGGK